MHLDPSSLKLAGHKGTTVDSGRGPQPIGHNLTPRMGAEMVAYAHNGHVTFADPLTGEADNADLFGPGS